MASPNIRIKRSAVSGKRPRLSDLQTGELALNTYDGYLYTVRDTGGVGIGTTTSLLTPWTENYGGSSIYYENSVGNFFNFIIPKWCSMCFFSARKIW